MEPLPGILEIVKTYLNRCVKCDTGRQGTCPWLQRFQTLNLPTDPAPSTPEDRAIAAQEITGTPCSNQITFDELINQIDTYASSAQMPRDEAELVRILTRLETSLTRLKRLPKIYRPAFTDSVTAAIEQRLSFSHKGTKNGGDNRERAAEQSASEKPGSGISFRRVPFGRIQ